MLTLYWRIIEIWDDMNDSVENIYEIEHHLHMRALIISYLSLLTPQW
jgi:hypothetical protein